MMDVQINTLLIISVPEPIVNEDLFPGHSTQIPERIRLRLTRPFLPGANAIFLSGSMGTDHNHACPARYPIPFCSHLKKNGTLSGPIPGSWRAGQAARSRNTRPDTRYNRTAGGYTTAVMPLAVGA